MPQVTSNQVITIRLKVAATQASLSPRRAEKLIDASIHTK